MTEQRVSSGTIIEDKKSLLSELEQTCKLCLKYVHGMNLPTLDENMLCKLAFLHMSLAPSLEESNSICKECEEKIEGAFNFKTNLVNTEGCLAPYVSEHNKHKLNLREILENDWSSITDEIPTVEKDVCRLCKNFVNAATVIPLPKVLQDECIMEVFQGHIAELDLGVAENPVVCNSCQQSLVNFSALISTWATSNVLKDAQKMKVHLDKFETVLVKEEIIEDSYNNSNISRKPGIIEQTAIVKTESTDDSEDMSLSVIAIKQECASSIETMDVLQLKNEEVEIKEETEKRKRQRQTPAQYQQKYRLKLKQKYPVPPQTSDAEKKRKAANSKAYRERKKQLRAIECLTQARTSTESDEEKLRNAACSKVYSERTKLLKQEEEVLIQTRISTKLQKLVEEKIRKAANSKAYRERKKRLREEELLTQTLRSANQTLEELKKIDELRLRKAANSKKYRERKKRLRTEEVLNQKSSTQESSVHQSQSTKETRTTNAQHQEDDQSKRIPKTPAQRQKEYRQRKKEKRSKDLPKTNAQRQKEYRQRQKVKQIEEITETKPQPQEDKPSKRIPKTHAQRQKEYRERYPERSKKTNAQHCKDYRQRKKWNQAKASIIFLNESRQNKGKDGVEQRNQIKCECEKLDSQCEFQATTSTYHRRLENCTVTQNMEVDEAVIDTATLTVPDNLLSRYSNYYRHCDGHFDFIHNFKNNTFGHSCAVCDRLWWKTDLRTSSENHDAILKEILPNYSGGTVVQICATCKIALDKQKIPLLSTYNGFCYPTIPSQLPTLDLVSQRLISPKIPFMQIRRLRHVPGQYGIYGEIINVPISVDTMVNQLPRNIEDDHCFYVHIKKKLICKTSQIHGLVNKNNMMEWLTYLVQTPLFLHYNIKINDNFFNIDEDTPESKIDDISEDVLVDDNLKAQQQTLLWNEEKLFHTTRSKNNFQISKLFDDHAEELSFPTIYGGQFRTYRKGINVTPFLQATSELRRTDRRGADPQHLLYMAIKIMRQHVTDVTVAFKGSDNNTNITKEQIPNISYIKNCIGTNMAYLRCIPNSDWYWADRKKDLFAIVRQKGAPTAFMTLSANETGWTDLLKLLYKLQNNGRDISNESLSQMLYVDKIALVNDDAVTCAIYFNKLVSCLLHILQSKKRSPFGKYRVLHYFKRIEFQHRGSPRAHMFLWLDNAPADLLNDSNDIVQMIDSLVSVSAAESSGNVKLQTHKHTFTCQTKMDANKKQNCRFGAPSMPSQNTVALLPMEYTDNDYTEDSFQKYKAHYKLIRTNLENIDYTDFQHFYTHNNITSDEHYNNIIRAGIDRPMLFYKRQPFEKWHIPFNPFVLHHLQANMEFQIIQDELACAAYFVEYFNKANRGIGDLQRKIIEIMDENPKFDIAELTRKISVDFLQSVEMSAQEAAWYLLREPMAKSSIATVYIPTVYPTERQKIRKTLKELEPMEDDGSDISKENWFDKYEKRPEHLNDVTLAQFVSKYNKNYKGEYIMKKHSQVIRFHNYDMVENFNDYRREMVLLHIPFRSEEKDILVENKFIQLYEDNKDLISQRKKEFESNFNIEKTLEFCKQLCRDTEEDEEMQNEVNSMIDADL